MKPLILLTNDDGINSPGLLAAADALYDLGRLLIVAPKEQRTGMGRSFPPTDGCIHDQVLSLTNGQVRSFFVDASPAEAVIFGLLQLAKRRPALVVAGINYGENVGTDITCSGTIGAALEAACFGIPTLVVSLETAAKHHLSHSAEVDFSAAAFFTRKFAQLLVSCAPIPGVDILKVDVPKRARVGTPWRMTRVSRQRYYHPTRGGLGYRRRVDIDALERDSDIYALFVDRVVSVSPLTIDLTAGVDLPTLRRKMGEANASAKG